MAEKSFFFNAMVREELKTETNPNGYDRVINADDISDWQSAFFDTGVIKDGLSVTPVGGMVVNVNIGRAAIKGKGYANTTPKAITIGAADATARYDMIVLRYNNVQSTADTSRMITAEYKKGTSAVPTVNSLTRNATVYELLLAYVYVGANATSVTTVYDMRGKQVICPWFTPVKGYDDYYDAIIERHESNVTLASASTSVITDIPSKLYNTKYSLIEVYTNGLKEPSTAYTVSLSGGYIVVTFTAQKSAGAKITVNLDNFIDGEGMIKALTQYTQLVQDVANLNIAGEYNYICNGVNDNVVISTIAQTFINDATIPANAQLTINVYGSLGITAAYGGDGTASNRYRWFDIGTPVGSDKRIIVDFTHCNIINVPLKGNTRNVIFNGYNTHVKNARLVANCEADGCLVFIFASNNGEIKAENCYFESLVTSDVYLSYSGTFINCEAYLSSKATHAYCFYLVSASKPVIVIGGRYRAYTGNSTTGYISAVAYSPTAETNASIVMYGVNIPTLARSGYVQKHAILIYGGYITASGLITALPITTATSVNASITGTIPLSK
jgi:hypothetical protein